MGEVNVKFGDQPDGTPPVVKYNGEDLVGVGEQAPVEDFDQAPDGDAAVGADDEPTTNADTGSSDPVDVDDDPGQDDDGEK